MPQFVRVERDGAVAVVHLDRPKVNAINVQVVAELDGACAEIESGDGIRAAVLYGGPRAFSAGADLEEMSQGSPDDVRKRIDALQRVIDRVEALPVVTIAAISRFALGGGCELALGCDFRLTSGIIGQPEVAVGLIPGAGGTQRLTRLVGPARTKWMVYTGESVDAATAVSWGLADEAVDGDVFERAMEWATRFANGPTLSLAAAKRAIGRSLDVPLRIGLDIELDEFIGLFSTHDTRHGIETFLREGPGKATFEGR